MFERINLVSFDFFANPVHIRIKINVMKTRCFILFSFILFLVCFVLLLAIPLLELSVDYRRVCVVLSMLFFPRFRYSAPQNFTIVIEGNVR